MSDYEDKILERATLRQIQSFLLTGSETTNTDRLSYQENMNYYLEILASLEDCSPEDQYNEIFYNLSKVLLAHREFYMEIGMKAGARLVCELLDIKK